MKGKVSKIEVISEQEDWEERLPWSGDAGDHGGGTGGQKDFGFSSRITLNPQV